MDSHPKGETYIGWIPSGQAYGTYKKTDGVTPVSPKMITNAITKSNTSERISPDATPFSDWNIPKKVIRVCVRGHADLFVMPVTDSILLTEWEDRSLPHSTDTHENLRELVKKYDTRIVLRSDSPFRTQQTHRQDNPLQSETKRSKSIDE